jgi:hypothetical protein
MNSFPYANSNACQKNIEKEYPDYINLLLGRICEEFIFLYGNDD